MNNWPVKKLGEVADFQKGKMMPNSSVNIAGSTPYILIDDLRSGNYAHFTQSNQGTACLPTDSLLVWDGANAGTVGGGLQGFVGSTISKISPAEVIDPFFLNLFLSSKFGEFNKQVHGAAIPHLNKDFVHTLPIVIPPLSIQKKIVERLDAIRKAQELCDQQIQKTEELFESLIYKEIESLDSDTKQLGEVCNFQYGYTQSASDSGTHRFIRITDIDENGDLRNGDTKYISDESRLIKSHILKSGDLLVARTGATYGKVLYFNLDQPSVFASYLIRIIPDTSVIMPEFIWLFSRSKSYWDQAKRLATGSGQPQFNANKIKEIRIKIPSLDKQQKIVEKLEAVQNFKKLLQNEKILLKELFDSVLDSSMSSLQANP